MLKHLREIEMENMSDIDDEALAAYNRNKGRGGHRSRGSYTGGFNREGMKGGRPYKCYLCGKQHKVSECDKLEHAKKLLKEDKIKPKKNRARKKYSTSTSTSKRPSTLSAPKRRPRITDMVQQQTASLTHPFLDLIPITKTLNLLPSSRYHQFLSNIKRRTIMVGGGKLYSDQKRTVELVCEDGSAMVLSDVLYEPNLGVDLLSGRRLCEHGLRGAFDSVHMHFMQDSKRIVTATMNQGLYIVSHISKTEAFFPCKSDGN
ncbi:hypothetical protein BJ878DRAFT_510630 [Calycina marina]|uniref:Uncharacterized protein n=1 Tax=Calycina marina TaxID=1763456 RepID=A0A9P8CE90_9HELO|nr:hypothetical protein BJ878DRAFT_510630 [Calycina marina]